MFCAYCLYIVSNSSSVAEQDARPKELHRFACVGRNRKDRNFLTCDRDTPKLNSRHSVALPRPTDKNRQIPGNPSR